MGANLQIPRRHGARVRLDLVKGVQLPHAAGGGTREICGKGTLWCAHGHHHSILVVVNTRAVREGVRARRNRGLLWLVLDGLQTHRRQNVRAADGAVLATAAPQKDLFTRGCLQHQPHVLAVSVLKLIEDDGNASDCLACAGKLNSVWVMVGLTCCARVWD